MLSRTGVAVRRDGDYASVPIKMGVLLIGRRTSVALDIAQNIFVVKHHLATQPP
jgi:hypothetical protein